MASCRSKWLHGLLALGCIVLLAAGPAFGQYGEDEETGPYYDVPTIESGRPWLQWVVGGVFAATVVMMAMKNPHRSHLD